MEKGTASALWNEIISNEVTAPTARFWWLHRCLLPLLGECWLRGRLSVPNARSQCAVNKIKVLPREESQPSAAEQLCSKQVDFPHLRQQELQAPLSLQQPLQCVSTWEPWVTQGAADIVSHFSLREESGCLCFCAWLLRAGWMSLLLLTTELFLSCPNLSALVAIPALIKHKQEAIPPSYQLAQSQSS